MLLKKLLFLMLPLLVVYWRSRTAQQAARWLFRGVVPQDGTIGKVMAELRQNPGDGQTTDPRLAPRPGRSRTSLAARIANNWPTFLAFLAGVAVTAILLARFSRPE